MANNIVLKTYKGGNITPQDDAIIYQTVIPMNGIFKGCEVSYARGNVLRVSQGFGMVRGRFFELYETEIDVRLADGDKTLEGRIYVHIDLSNADNPAQLQTITAEVLPELERDSDINYNNSVFDMELALFSVSATEISNLRQVSSKITASNGGGNTVERLKQYSVGAVVTVACAPDWVSLYCIKEGTTSATEPLGYAQITKVGDTVLDGTAEFVARNVLGELDGTIQSVGNLKTELTGLEKEVADKLNSAGSMTVKALSLEEYKTLTTYSDSMIYLCYENADTKKITRIYMGKANVFSTGVKVTYQVDTGYSFQKIIEMKEDALLSAPIVTKAGFTLVGWRSNQEASDKVLDSYMLEVEEPIILYAVFKKTITLDMAANGGTLLGEKPLITATCFYNNGNAKSEGVTIPVCPFTRANMSFCGWSIDSIAAASYKPGDMVVFQADVTLYAMWVTTVFDFTFTGTYIEFIVPADGIYELEVWGGSGGDAKADALSAEGGLGGHAKGYKQFTKGQVLYVLPGGAGGVVNQGYSGLNGGSGGYSYLTSKTYGAGGGGATHIATKSGNLGGSNLTYANMASILIVAGGGGGAGIIGATSTLNKGGDGGGERGGDGSGGALAGRQISNGATSAFNFGLAGSNSGTNSSYAGGGGGFYGGTYGTLGHSGSGGSGYIGGVPGFTRNNIYYPAENEAGINKGNGKAYIRYVLCV